MPEYKMKVTRQVIETTEVTVYAKNADEARNKAENGIILFETSISGPEKTRTVDEKSIEQIHRVAEEVTPTTIHEKAEEEFRQLLSGLGGRLAKRHMRREIDIAHGKILGEYGPKSSGMAL